MSKEIFGKLSSKEQDLVLRGPARLLIIEMKRNGIDSESVPKNKMLSDVKPGCILIVLNPSTTLYNSM